MREFRTRQGPYPVRLHYEVAEIDDICRDALKACGLLPKEPAPIDVERFLEKYFEVRVVYEDIGPDVMGCTIFDRRGAVTGFIISPRIEEAGTKSSERRARSTLAHEGGHGLLHPKLFIEESTGSLFGPSSRLSQPNPRFLCRSSDISPVSNTAPSYGGRWWEWQANRVIGGLLLPRDLVRNAIAALFKNGSFGSQLREARRQEAESLLAEIFDVNPVVARIRLQEMFPASAQMSL